MFSKIYALFLILFVTFAMVSAGVPDKGTLSGKNIHTIVVPASANGGVSSDVINLARYNHASFVVSCGNMAGATSTLTVKYCDNNTPSTATAMAFNYRKMTDGAGATDTLGALTACASTGLALATTAETVIIELDAIEIYTASSGTCSRVQLVFSNPSAAAYISAVAICSEPAYASGTPVTVID